MMPYSGNYYDELLDPAQGSSWNVPTTRLGDPYDRDMAAMPRRRPKPYNGSYEAQSNLYAQEESTLKNLRCVWPRCGKCFDTEIKELQHFQTHTGSEPPFACPCCPETSMGLEKLLSHMGIVHLPTSRSRLESYTHARRSSTCTGDLFKPPDLPNIGSPTNRHIEGRDSGDVPLIFLQPSLARTNSFASSAGSSESLHYPPSSSASGNSGYGPAPVGYGPTPPGYGSFSGAYGSPLPISSFPGSAPKGYSSPLSVGGERSNSDYDTADAYSSPSFSDLGGSGSNLPSSSGYDNLGFSASQGVSPDQNTTLRVPNHLSRSHSLNLGGQYGQAGREGEHARRLSYCASNAPSRSTRLNLERVGGIEMGRRSGLPPRPPFKRASGSSSVHGSPSAVPPSSAPSPPAFSDYSPYTSTPRSFESSILMSSGSNLRAIPRLNPSTNEMDLDDCGETSSKSFGIDTYNSYSPSDELVASGAGLNSDRFEAAYEARNTSTGRSLSYNGSYGIVDNDGGRGGPGGRSLTY